MDNVTLLDSYKETFDAFKKLFNFRLFFHCLNIFNAYIFGLSYVQKERQ